jgi:putative flippase GtrA
VKKLLKKIKFQLIIEILTYGVVGGVAWLTQTIGYITLINLHNSPLTSMVLGNLFGMLVSYYGHVKYTFKKNKLSHKDFIRFTLASLIGLLINTGSVKIVTSVLHLNPHFGIVPTLFTPLITFLISKFWVFK